MSQWLHIIWSRGRAVLGKDRLDHEFDDELTTHLELLVDEHLRGGMSQAEARREALRRLGRPSSLRESHREQRGLPALEVFAQDLRYAVRMLWKSRAFTCIAVLSLSLGIGANTALFSLVNNLLLRSLPVREPDRLVQVQQFRAGDPIKKPRIFFPESAFEYIRAHNQVLSEIAGCVRMDRPTVLVDGVAEPERQVELVTANFFSGLGVTPVLGRTPQPSDGRVAVISYRLWRARFDGSSGILSRTLTIDGEMYAIIGVAPRPFLGLSIDDAVDLWVSPHQSGRMIARLKPGATSFQAQAELQVLFRQFEPGRRGEPPLQTEILPAGKGLSELRPQFQRPLLALAVLVALVLLITCANVGNLLMVRVTARRRELTVRVALGARRSQLILQCVMESAVLAASGGILALVFARWGVSALLSMLSLPAMPQALVFQADARVVGFVAAVSVASALLFGLAPAWRAAQVNLADALKSSQGSTQAKSARRLGRLLVASQVGLSVLLLVGAGLFLQTLRNLANSGTGFNPENLLQVRIDTNGSGYREGQVGALYRLLIERVSAIPGVHSVTGIRNPLMRGMGICRMYLPGRDVPPDENWDCADVAPFFFETINIPAVRGRTFTAADFARGRRLVAISETFAECYYTNEDPIGKLLRAPPENYEIVGVVRDVKLASVRAANRPMMYFMVPSEPDRLSALEVRTSGDPDAVAPAIGQEIRRINPRLFLGIRTVRQEIDRSIAKERMVAATSAFFGVLALLLASVGIFGVTSCTVAQRANELGIRIALGAGRWSVIRESLSDTMLVFGAGLAGGIIAAVVAVRLAASFIADLLFGLTATDAANMVAAVLLMVAAAFAACILPARNATRIDPLTALTGRLLPAAREASHLFSFEVLLNLLSAWYQRDTGKYERRSCDPIEVFTPSLIL